MNSPTQSLLCLSLLLHAPLLVWGQEVSLDFPDGRVFGFAADPAEALDVKGGGTKGLRRAALAWCGAQQGLAIAPEQCAEMVSTASAKKLLEARTALSQHPRAGQHGLTPSFFEAVDAIHAPEYGTEQLGPLLHALVRFHRPEQVVELGFGYTTPFLAQALADNAANVRHERLAENVQRQKKLLLDRWYAEHPQYEAPSGRRLTVVDDQSQRGGAESGFGDAVGAALDQLNLTSIVNIESSMDLANAHVLFAPDSLGLVWNDAQWDPAFLKRWWPLLKKDGGLLLLHNVIGNGAKSRWCVAPPRKIMRTLFPDEKFEFITLLEPHKGYQGSVALLRRLDPAKAPDKFQFLVPGEVPRDGVRQYDPGDFGDMLDWTATDTEQQSTGKAKPKKKTKKKRDLKRDEARNEAWWHGPGGLPHDREL